ncbi:HecB [Xenorhabdus mauleonii]|uniref:HecB n=2 Tax=Xenorhabdus mauleonii TaxID=351675 RepID=A0A1I3QK35_9GAMM|nr:ShlB/FhaC/HecB family hemolysin secretion/activation protein [Xenorhabdus mauleonii]PHM39920.1 HecB [Xenorhabdus mauleonii]SFJ34514.1 Hemolysin activation/secretion protein [Xenorhabdus mauleonii]
MIIRKNIKFLFYLGLIISSQSLALSNINPSNNIDLIDQDIINQKQKELLEESQKKEDFGSNLKTPQAKSSVVLEDNLPCKIIKNISIENAEHYPKSKQDSLIAQNISKCMTLKDVKSLIDTISAHYMEKGYITSAAFLKQQNLAKIAKGNLIISVIEGKIDNINVDGENPVMLDMVFPNMKGKILNLRDIEQGLDQLNRLPSYQVKIDIQPSDKPGYSDIILKKGSSKIPASVDLSLDNSGQKRTGETQASVFLRLDNTLQLADSLTFYLNKDTDFSNRYKSWYIASGLSIPYGYWLFNYRYTKNESNQYIPLAAPNYGELPYMGKGRSHSILANRVLYRDGKQKLSLNTGFTSRKTKNVAGTFTLDSSSNLSTLNLGFEYSTILLGGYFRFNPSMTKGLSIFGATEDNNLKNSAKSKFHKFSASSSYYKPLTKDIYYFTSAYGQYSQKNLYSSERLSIGGLYSVRGFKDQKITGNSGFYWRNELNWKLMTTPKLGELSLNGSIDTGWLKDEYATRFADGGSLTGASLGLNLNTSISNHSIAVGKPLNYPGSLKPDDWIIYWSTSFNF